MIVGRLHRIEGKIKIQNFKASTYTRNKNDEFLLFDVALKTESFHNNSWVLSIASVNENMKTLNFKVPSCINDKNDE